MGELSPFFCYSSSLVTRYLAVLARCLLAKEGSSFMVSFLRQFQPSDLFPSDGWV